MRVNRKNANGKGKAAQASVRSSLIKTSEVHLDAKKLFPVVDADHKAFRFPAVMRARKQRGDPWKRVTFPIRVSQSDQGSELNVITNGLVKALGYERIALTSSGKSSGLTMDTACGGSS